MQEWVESSHVLTLVLLWFFIICSLYADEFEYVVCQMLAILFMPPYVNS